MRALLAERFLFGEGLEIGALHQPLAVPPHATVRYVDRMTVEELRRHYPELESRPLIEADLIDDGESLSKVTADSQSFIVASHFLEHCENPIGTIEAHLEKLKPGGVLFYAVPDKRFTFDFRRPPTSLEHLVADYEQGPDRSRREHYEEWATMVDAEVSPDGEGGPPDWASHKARRLEADGYSIHMHVWTPIDFLRLILHCRERFEAFEIEVAAQQGFEFIVLLRKHGPFPDPPPTPDQEQIPTDKRWRTRLRRAAGAARRELRGT